MQWIATRSFVKDATVVCNIGICLAAFVVSLAAHACQEIWQVTQDL